MSDCMSHDCYYENLMHHDFDIKLRDFFVDDSIFELCYLCSVALVCYLSFLLFFNFGYRCDYLDGINDVYEDECDKEIKYDRSMWPYKSNTPVPCDLEERMKYWEKCSQQITVIDPRYPFIVRLDGCSFSKFTKQLKQFSPNGVYSEEFRDAMVDTACDLLLKFRPMTVYTHSDEITLVFRDYIDFDEDMNEVVTGEHYRKGKVYKLLSELPSYASTSFTKNINKRYLNKPDTLEYLDQQTLAFDARVIVFPLEATYEIANHMIWRTRDCYRNYVSAYAEKHFSERQLRGVSTENRVSMLKSKDIDLTDETTIKCQELGMKYGTFFKLYSSDKTHTNIQAFYSHKLKFSDELLDFLVCPMKDLMYANEDDENTSELNLNIEDTVKSFAFDSYEFEDCFDGTFKLQKEKRKI